LPFKCHRRDFEPEASDIARVQDAGAARSGLLGSSTRAIEAAFKAHDRSERRGFLMLPADVPEITIAAIHQAFAALDQSRSLVLAPAISDGGTNLLACDHPTPIRPESAR